MAAEICASARWLAQLWLWLPLIVVLGACSSGATDGHVVEITARYPAGLGLDHLVVEATLPTDPARTMRSQVPAEPRPLADTHETLVLVLPEEVEAAFELTIEGWSKDTRLVLGRVLLDPNQASAEVTLAAETCASPPCGPTCGDGAVDEGEACDDGRTDDGDGCDASCGVESGWRCAGAPSLCEPDCPDGCPTCGDGEVQSAEDCDDGDRRSGDGCNVACEIEDGWQCVGAPSRCAPLCGDGLIVGGEACDDDNRSSGDGCADTCEVEVGFLCAGEPSGCAAICGDELLRGDETCDDGSTVPGDGCNGDCEIEQGWQCEGEPSICTRAPPPDAGPRDAGDPLDAGPDPDAEIRDDDAGFIDAGATDAQTPDAGFPDAGAPDAGAPDAGFTDAHVLDASPPDAGLTDAQTPDAGLPDAGAPDAGLVDSGVPDVGVPDSGVPVATQLTFAPFPSNVVVGACSPGVLQRRDANGATIAEAVARDVVLQLQSGNVSVFQDSACTRSASTVRLRAGRATVALSVRALAVGAFELVASTPGLTDARLSSTADPGTPVAVNVSGGPSGLTWGECGSQPVTIQVVDAMGNPVTSAADRTLSLSVSPTEGLLVDTTAGCGNPSRTITLPRGASSVTAYLRAERLGSMSAQISSAGLTSATLAALTVAPATASCASCSTLGVGCYEDCAANQDCRGQCNNGCACQMECGQATSKCEIQCKGGAHCLIDCTGQNNCEPDCKGGATCIIECDSANNCDKVKCRQGASCLLDCSGANNCDYDSCSGGKSSCPGNIIACNRACP